MKAGDVYLLEQLPAILDAMAESGVAYGIAPYYGKADAIVPLAKPAPVKPEQKQRRTEQAQKMF